MGVVSLYKRVGMVYEMLICNESFLGRISQMVCRGKGLPLTGRVFKFPAKIIKGFEHPT